VKDTKNGAIIIGINEGWERVAASAARMSTLKGNAIDVFDSSEDNAANLKSIKKVLSSGHSSIIEHIVFNIAFCDVSAVVEQFMIQFRLASFMVKSRRYVDFYDAGFFLPENLDTGQKNIFASHVRFLFAEYKFLTENNIPKEDARFVLPYCFYSNFYCTVNARELLLILRRMMYGPYSAVAEIKGLGEQLLRQLKLLCPVVYDEFYASRSEYMQDEGERYKCGPKLFTLEQNVARKDERRAEIVSFTKDAAKILAAEAAVRGKPAADALPGILKSARPRELEHLLYTFIFRGISLSGITHIARHRIQSLTVPPLFCAEPFKFLTPETVRNDKTLKKRYESAFIKNAETAGALKQDGAPGEVLIYLALSGNLLDIMSTMNARELLLFFKLRTCSRAQWEIRDFADDLLGQLSEIEPDIFGPMGPSCKISGVCPEGALSCGKKRFL